MQIIIVLIIILLFLCILFKSISIIEIYGEEDLIINEKLHITISKDNETLIVPEKIGIKHDLWKDHSFDFYSYEF